MVHRLLGCYLEHHLNMIGLEEVLPEAQLAEIGKHITFTEQRAEDAERELKTVLILQMLSKNLGQELDCVVSGLTNFGVFVQCIKFGIEGLVGFDDLGDDEWGYNHNAQAVLGRHSGKSVHLGEPMRVRIVSVNVPGRHLDLAPVEPLAGSRQQPQNPQKQNYRKKRKLKFVHH